jgi:hypothetical protein
MTNHHCIDASDFPNHAIDRIRLELGVLSNSTSFEVFNVGLAPAEDSRELDYAILTVDKRAEQRFGYFKLAVRDPRDSEELFIVHHPLGQPQSLSRYRCRADTPATVGRTIRHLCNTQPGSSGSPVLSDNDNTIVGLHNAGIPVSSSSQKSNAGIRLSSILAKSPLLNSLGVASDSPIASAAVPPNSTAAQPSPANAFELEICPTNPSKTYFYSVSFDAKTSIGWFQAIDCRRFSALNIEKMQKVYIYDVGYWDGQFQSVDFPTTTASARIPVCGLIADGNFPYYSFSRIGKYDPNGQCSYKPIDVLFYEAKIGARSTETGLRINLVRAQ